MFTIYCVSNNVNGKCYIGQTRFLVKRRWRDHIRNALKGSSLKFHCAIRKYGAQNFSIRALCYCSTRDEANTHEKYFIFFFKSTHREFGYNLTFGGDGVNPTEEVKEKQSAWQKGKNKSPEHRAALSAAHVTPSRESYAKAAKSNKAAWDRDPERKRLASERFKGKKRGREACENMIAAITGKPKSAEHRARLSVANIGKKLSKEHRAAISAGLLRWRNA